MRRQSIFFFSIDELALPRADTVRAGGMPRRG